MTPWKITRGEVKSQQLGRSLRLDIVSPYQKWPSACFSTPRFLTLHTYAFGNEVVGAIQAHDRWEPTGTVVLQEFVYHQDMLGNFWTIADGTAKRQENEQGGDAAFAVSKRPLVPRESQRQEVSRNQSRDYENLGELPRSYGRPVLFGIARDPSTLFVYWEIDWHRAFGDKPPADRKVYLRVFSDNGDEEIRATVEPLAGNHCVPVTQASGIYRIELGYDEPAGVWNSVAQSDRIATPPDDVSDDASIDVATVPFHLSFQHMIDSFRGSNYDGDALVGMVGRLQERADGSAETDLPEADRELLRAIGCTLSGSEGGHRARLRRVENAFATRQKVEAILGFGGGASFAGNPKSQAPNPK